MPQIKIKSLGADSGYKGRISAGCRQCAKGRKMVLFITGECDFHCFSSPFPPINLSKLLTNAHKQLEKPKIYDFTL
jgi:pyruvate formate-lyase activating enzyme-like uncharacterized protein